MTSCSRLLVRLLAGSLATALPLLVLLPPAVAQGAAASASTSASAAPLALPVIPSTVNSGRPCTAPSAKSTSEIPWPLTFLRARDAWQLTRGAGVLVAVIDSGVDAVGTPALAGQVIVGPDVVAGGSAGTDCVGHGTFIAGLIAAKQQDGVGFAGLAPQAKVLAVRATDATGATSPDAIAAAIVASVDAGSRVVEVSLSVSQRSDALDGAVQYAKQHNVLVIAATTADGATGATSTGPAYPASYPSVLAVSDIDAAGAAPTSTSTDVLPALVAPGDAVMSVGPGGSGYFTGSGPSFAAGYVAAAAALVLSYRPHLTAVQLAYRLAATAYPPDAGPGDGPLGYGTVDPTSAVATVLPEEYGGHPAARRAPPFPPVLAPTRTQPGSAILIAMGALLLVIVVVILRAVVTRGRNRRWRPARPSPSGGWAGSSATT